MRSQGKFVVFEGPDGAGKTTQMHKLYSWLSRLGHDVTRVREPGGTQVSELIRDILKHHEMTPEAELLLFSAARAETVKTAIQPQLEEGKIVLCDRYIYSTYAYQCRARGLPFSVVRTITNFATNKLRPDLIFYLHVSLEEATRRMKLSDKEDRFDKESEEFHSEVRKGYSQMIKGMSTLLPDLWQTIYTDGNTVAETQAEVRSRIKERFTWE